jgi:NAD(P)-dependent dehydrogenase (short-subunit alcohol dehydrogenase family)
MSYTHMSSITPHAVRAQANVVGTANPGILVLIITPLVSTSFANLTSPPLSYPILRPSELAIILPPTMASFQNRIIAITGGASGIGLATAHLLASRGATLCLADVKAVALEEAKKALKQTYPDVQIHIYILNVASEAEVEHWIAAIIEKYGRLDGAANLAGVIGKSISGIEEIEMSEWDFIMNVNLKGVMLCLKYELRVMKKGASIVNASSIAGLRGTVRNAAYSASKHGVVGLTRSAAKEVGGRGVRVNAICPYVFVSTISSSLPLSLIIPLLTLVGDWLMRDGRGYIDTPMTQHLAAMQEASAAADAGELIKKRQNAIESVALGRAGKAEECAELIAYLLSDGASFMTGNAVSVDGGWNC